MSVDMNSLYAEIDRLRVELEQKDRLIGEYQSECKWVFDEDACYYDTGCGEAYCLIDGTLAENKHKHCPYCGKKVAGVKE